ncbi:MAG: hypothetical protein KJ052_11055 [Candidatus Hydrogenedentes bacterium]|nr:hypothetical protein [Candidatus Hydrogenedentota bacterium]
MRTYGYALAFVALTGLAAGCASQQRDTQTEVVYSAAVIADEPTPPGTVAPPQPQVIARPYRPDSIMSGTSDFELERQRREAAHAAFKSAYKASGNPRIVAYFNRELSDDVQEWTSQSRVKVGYGEATTTESSGGATSTTVTSGGVAASVETRTPSDEGLPVAETWQWRLEDAFVQSIAGAGAVIVDRTLIMRSTAASQPQTAYGDLAVKQIEMQALEGKADILAEIVISRQPDVDYGYLFRSRAYDIKTGAILVSTSSATWLLGPSGVSTSDPDVYVLPNPEIIGQRLADELIVELGQKI